MPAFPSSSSTQVSVAQAAAAVELHRQDEESAQLSSISVRHMTVKAPAPPHTHTHTHKHKESTKGVCRSFDCSDTEILSISICLSLHPGPPPVSLLSAHYPLYLHTGCQRAQTDGETTKIKALEQY